MQRLEWIEGGWRSLWRLWSVKLAAIFGILVATLLANYGLLLGLVAFMPNGPMRYLVAVVIGVAVFVVPSVVRGLKQQEKPCAPDQL